RSAPRWRCNSRPYRARDFGLISGSRRSPTPTRSPRKSGPRLREQDEGQIEIGVSMQDLTLPAARAERDGLADRTDVLDKVGVLRTLPDDMHALTPMVADFYGVGLEAV